MKKQKIQLKVPEGNFISNVIIFDKSDIGNLMSVWKNWQALCLGLKNLDSRAVNIPEGLSESCFCLAMNCMRVSKIEGKTSSSFDCYDAKTCERVQVKASSVLPDLTSFGPNSVWDTIYFMHFRIDDKNRYLFDIYKLNSDDVNNHKVNKNQTLSDQKQQGKRPRFSIYKELIQKRKYVWEKTFHMTDTDLNKV